MYKRCGCLVSSHRASRCQQATLVDDVKKKKLTTREDLGNSREQCCDEVESSSASHKMPGLT